MTKIKMEIIGQDLNDGQGYLTYEQARKSIDFESPPYGRIFRVKGENVQLVKLFGRPVFDFWKGGEK